MTRGAPTVLWTCDHCRHEESRLADQVPEGWVAVSSKPLAGHASDKDYSGEWCKTCAATYLQPLPMAMERTRRDGSDR